MKHYVYIDYNNGRQIIFECDANGILEADGFLFKATGIVASKESNIGCIIQ